MSSCMCQNLVWVLAARLLELLALLEHECGVLELLHVFEDVAALAAELL